MKPAKRGGALILLFALTYMTSYITRINYGAIISEMVTATGIPKSLLSLSLTGSFITYGAGQIVSGILGDKFSPKSLVTLGLSLSVLINITLPFFENPYIMLVLWCINGFAQAFMWPPMVKLITANFDGAAYDNAIIKISWGSSIGTILIYLAAPLVLSFAGWKWVFWLSAACGAVMIIIWNLFCPSDNLAILTEKTVAADTDKAAGMRLLFSPLLIAIMLAIILQGMLRDGVTTWMPSYISETYSLGNEIAILSGVVMPILSILCFQITGLIHRLWVKNPILCAGFIFGAGALTSLALFILTGRGAAASIILSALLTATMHGVNLLLICMVPNYFKKYGNVSTVSGVLNSCTYIGSALSTNGIALISENAGWKTTLLIWFLIAAAGTAICLASAAPWKKKIGG